MKKQYKILFIGIGKSYTPQMRDALYWSLITENDFKYFNPSYSFASTLFPDFFELNTEKINMYNPQGAKILYNNEIKKVKDRIFPTDTIYYYGDNDIEKIAKCIAGHWQQNLGIYINIAPTTSNSEANAYSKSGYGIGIYTVEINQKSTEKYLQNFDALANSNITSIQDGVFNDSYNIPISFYGTCFAYNDNLTNLKIESTGGSIDFSLVTKK